jgi:hypothetical protein
VSQYEQAFGAISLDSQAQHQQRYPVTSNGPVH